MILPNDPHSLIDTEFKIEGFQRAKIIGISNGRAIVILTNNAGHNSYEEMSLNTVEMLKSLSEEK
jgi:rhamnogalacturonyl hydrolase YesR